MAKDIKVKKEKKGDIKQLNRNVKNIQKIKNNTIKVKEEISNTIDQNENNSNSNEVNYAINQIKNTTNSTIYNYNKYGKESIKETKENITKAKENINNIKIKYATNKLIKQKENETINKKSLIFNEELKREEQINDLTFSKLKAEEKISTERIKTKDNIPTNFRLRKQYDSTINKFKESNTIKTIQNSNVDIIKNSANKEINIIGNTNTQQVSNYINKTKDKIIKDTKNIKQIFQKLLAGLKALTRGTKAILLALFASGWIFGLIIIIIMLVGLFCSSTFGIFFANEGVDGSKPLKEVIKEINTEFSHKISDIQTSIQHDDYDIVSNRAKIKDVIAVYAAKVSGADDGQEVITMTPEKEAIFKKIFWDMNKIDYNTEIQRESHIEKDNKGKDKVVTTTKTILHIKISSKTAYEMADYYHFNKRQRQQLEELLSDKYANLWSSLLYGSSTGNGAIVEVAASQIGNVGGEPYWSWYGFPSRVSWCACFVSWCANECGFIDSGIIPKFAACQDQGISWFKACGQWQESGYIANPGDIIFFDWEHDGHSDHVGIVESVEDGTVHTIEGNTNDSCARRQYSVDSLDICGYGVPMYN